MVVVFRIFHSHMECLPLYTNDKRGVAKKPEQEKKEWVRAVDPNSTHSSAGENTHPPLTVKLERPVNENSFIHITESVQVYCAENVKRVGNMDRSNFERLHELRAGLNVSAQAWPDSPKSGETLASQL